MNRVFLTQVASRRGPRSRNHLLSERMHEGGRPALAGGNMCFPAARVSGPADRRSGRQMC